MRGALTADSRTDLIEDLGLQQPAGLGPVPHSRTVLEEEDIAAATVVLRSGQLVASEVTKELERVTARLLRRKHAWATAGGTAALYSALRCMEISEGDRVLVPTYVCDDVLSAVLRAGADPVPVDLDAEDLNPDPRDAQPKVGRRTRAIVVAHALGMPARVSEFQELGIPVLDDCAHGLGGEVNSEPVGSQGRCAVLSFHALKMVTAGEGGMLLTDDDGIADAYRRFQQPDFAAGDYRLHSRMSNVLAAIAIRQLARFGKIVERRRLLADRYIAELSNLDRAKLVPVNSGDGRRSSCYRFALITDGTLTFDDVETAFLDRGVVVRRPVKQLSHRTLGMAPETCPAAEALFDRIVSLPLYPNLTEAEQDRVIDATHQILA
jgi:perosamine synthetase